MIVYKAKEIMKRFKIIAVILLIFWVSGCGKKKEPTVGIDYCYYNYSDDCVYVISPDESCSKCNIDWVEDFDYNDGNVFFVKADNIFKANIESNEIYSLTDEDSFRIIREKYDFVGNVVALGGTGDVAVKFWNDGSETASVYIISNGEIEYLCEVDGKGINNNNKINWNKAGFSADKRGENLFVKHKNQLVKLNIQNKTETILISDFKYDIFDVDASEDKVTYIFENNIYIYEISSGNETQIETLEFPVGKIRISDDGNWIMVLDVNAPKGFFADFYPPSPIYNLYIYDCVNKKMIKVVEGGCGGDWGGFDFAE